MKQINALLYILDLALLNKYVESNIQYIKPNILNEKYGVVFNKKKVSKTLTFSLNILGHCIITFKYLFDIFKSMMEPGPYLGRGLHKTYLGHFPTQILRH